LDPGLVPVREFPLRKWYYADPLWYYHVPALEHRLTDDPQFYAKVDPPLRALCRLLLEAGLCTTPSCSGHFYPRERFERIWSGLARDAEAIRGEGLRVKDSETEAAALFRDSEYCLPWQSADDFYAKAGSEQNHGYLGIAIPVERSRLIERLRRDAYAEAAASIRFDDELTRLLGQPLFGVYVRTHAQDECDAVWARVTEYFDLVVSRAA
jgi:hypothetical protein